MIERTLARRYAAALLRATDPEGSTEEAETLLLALKQAYVRQKAFRDLLSQPRIPRLRKKELLHRVAGSQAPSSVKDFLNLLVDKGRIDLLPDVADMFDRLADASKGIVRVKVRSWRPVSKVQEEALAEKLGRLTGKKILVEARTDPALKGGMLVHIGDTVIDGSVAARLKAIEERFRELQKA